MKSICGDFKSVYSHVKSAYIKKVCPEVQHGISNSKNEMNMSKN